MFVLLGILKASGLDIFYSYSAIWIVAFHIQICCDRFGEIQRLHLHMLIKDGFFFIAVVVNKDEVYIQTR